MILGDSSTTKDKWPEVLISAYLPKSATVINTAQGGAIWGKKSKILSVVEQWNKAKDLLKGSKPDILIITVGGNSFPDPKISYDDVLALCEQENTEKMAPDQMKEAILALRTIIADYPDLDIYLVANFYAGSNPKKDGIRRHYRTQLAALCDFYSCNLVDLTRNSNIRGRLEKDPKNRIFINDSVHITTEAGKARIARLIFAALKANYPDPETD
ncbi:MAG: SGNH/GDSL hydrolase family protein [Planctomycetia bacterium]|nr:SGNH/GDSL hydrolase family protein [Planctomycetia bacterium]